VRLRNCEIWRLRDLEILRFRIGDYRLRVEGFGILRR
jgi:hypothetical protein